jgi:hypothetical protein
LPESAESEHEIALKRVRGAEPVAGMLFSLPRRVRL